MRLSFPIFYFHYFIFSAPALVPILIPSVVKNVLVQSKPINHGRHRYDLD